MLTKILGIAIAGLFSVTAFASPQIQNWQTQAGTQVLFFEADALPMVDIRLIFDAGAARDDVPGTALLTNAMLNQGTQQSDDNTIAAAFDDVGAEFGSEAERDMAIVSLRTLTQADALEKAVNMFVEVLSQPTFPQAAVERQKNQLRTRLQSERQSPEAIAARAMNTALYGEHPYANMPNGELSTVDNLNREILEAFYQQYYVANNAVLVIVGELTETQARALSEQISNQLPVGDKAATLPPVQPLNDAQTIEIDYPASQTQVLVGQIGMSRDDVDYFPLFVGNHILGGGGLVSILSDEIREKRGLSYSTYSYFRPMRELGPFLIGLQTRNDQADEALKVVRETLANFIENGPTVDQLEAAQKNITGGFALRTDSNSKIADYLGVIAFYDLPLNYLDTLRDKVNAVTVEQIKQAFQQRVHSEKTVTVRVGGKNE